MYKSWIYKLVALFAVLLIVISTVYKWLVVEKIYTNVDYTLSNDIDTLVVGSSHLEGGFDDSKYENVLNLSNSGMPYYFTYLKIKRLVATNPQVKRLIISFSPIHIAPYGDLYFFSDEGLSRELSFRFFPLLDDVTAIGDRRYSVDFVATYLKYELGVPFNYMEDLKLVARYYFSSLAFMDLDFVGRYKPSEGSNLNPLKIQSKAEFYFGNEYQHSEYAVTALRKIIALAKASNIEVEVLSMPMHRLFKQYIPQQYQTDYQALMTEISNDNAHVEFIDYQHFELADEEFYDGDHINELGVLKLAPQLHRELFEKD